MIQRTPTAVTNLLQINHNKLKTLQWNIDRNYTNSRSLFFDKLDLKVSNRLEEIILEDGILVIEKSKKNT